MPRAGPQTTCKYPENHAEYQVRCINKVKKAVTGDESVPLMQREAPADAETTQEAVSRILTNVPTMLNNEIR